MIHYLSNLIAYAYGPVSDIEIVWSLIAAFGLCFSIYNFREARRDLIAVKLLVTTRRDRRVILANQTIKAEGARIIIQSIFLAIGLMAATIPSTPTPLLSIKLIIFRALFTWGLIIAASLLTLKSYWIYRLRQDLRDGLIEDDLREAALIERESVRDLAREVKDDERMNKLRQDLTQE